MHDTVELWVRGACDVMDITPDRPMDRVLEIGSLDINGTARNFIPHVEGGWYGFDRLAGRGVDEVLSSHDIPAHHPELKESHMLVVCLEMLEHDHDPGKTVDVIHWLLKPFGVALLSTRGPGFREHKDAPGVEDYMTRFTPDDIKALAYSSDLDVCNIQPDLKADHPGVFAMVRRHNVGVW